MKIHYALFDPSTDRGKGNYWTWFDEELPLELLNRFYYEIAVKHLAPEPNKLTADDLWGGIASFDSDWMVLYRFFNGGYDQQDRPGRYVVLTAWIRTDESTGIDLLPILTNKTFQKIATISKKLPVPPPTALTEIYTGTKTGKTLSISDTNLKKVFDGADAAQQATEYFANIPPRRCASLKIIMTSTEQKAVLETVLKGKPKDPVQEVQAKTPMSKSTIPTNGAESDGDAAKLHRENERLHNIVATCKEHNTRLQLSNKLLKFCLIGSLALNLILVIYFLLTSGIMSK